MTSTPNVNTEQNADKVSAWSLIKPYWVSEERGMAWLLLIAIIAINMVVVYITVRLNTWQGDFYNALQTKNVAIFPHLLMVFSVLVIVYILLAVYGLYLRQMLGFKWRQWLTNHYLEQWLGENAFYRIERDRLADNPDQRITDDLNAFASTTLSLSLDLLSTIVTLVSFITILWTIAGALSFSAFGTPITIPGYMVWVAALYAVVGSWLIQRFAHPLVSINYQQQRVEANFRFGLIRIRENAEQIALYNGVNTENAAAKSIFATIRANYWQIMKYTKRRIFVSVFYGQVAGIFPIVVASPRYFSGVYTLGVLMQISSSFGTVSDSFSWFINNYSSLVEWRATVNRLREFKRVMRSTHIKEASSPATVHGGINLHYTATDSLKTTGLKLSLPNGAALAKVGDVIVKPGSRWLVQGPSGSGKSTLMRAFAGLWPFGDGTIDAPVNAKMMFVPQQSYLPIGTLKAALSYPSLPELFTDEACRDALRACNLDAYGARLEESGHWAKIMSPGEHQRLAAARVILQKPDYIFLDEATSALDADNESHIYNAMINALPNAAIVSVAHRESVAVFHENRIEIDRAEVAVAA